MSAEVQLTNAGSGRYGHIDAMRAVAVLLVVIAHAGLGHIVPGGSGVTIFFAISGFIITHLVLKEHAKTGTFAIGRFYVRRLLKLAPPFLAVVALPTAIYSLWHPLGWNDFLAQVFFWFNWVYMTGDFTVLPGSVVVWSLAVEEQFYIGFALLWLWLVGKPNRLEWLLLVSALVAIGSLGMRLHIAETAFSHSRVYYGTDTRMDGIAIGVFAAGLFCLIDRDASAFRGVRRVLASDWLVILAIAAYLFSLMYRDDYFRETFRYSIQAMSASLLVLYGLLQRNSALRRLLQRCADLRLVQAIGLASYSIYLVHLSLNSVLAEVVSGWSKSLSVVFLSMAGVAVGLGIWRFIELPVEHYKRRLEVSRVSKNAGNVAAAAQ